MKLNFGLQRRFSDPGTKQLLLEEEMELAWVLYYVIRVSELPAESKNELWNSFSPEYREYQTLKSTRRISAEFKAIFTKRLQSHPDLVWSEPYGPHGARDRKWARCTPKKKAESGMHGK